jgi:hypothetical protein
MKKQLINEAFRLQQLAGIQPINSLNENDHAYDALMDAVDDTFKPGTPENEKLAAAVEKALHNSELEVYQYEVPNANKQVEMIAKEIGLMNEEEGSTEHLDELTLRLFIDELGLDSDNPAFIQAYKSQDIQDLIQAIANTAGDGSDEPLDGVFAQSDFITAADTAGFSDEMIEDILDSDPVRHLERG